MDSNGFVQLGIVQKLLWTYEERSKIFYLLIVSMILVTFTTSPLDPAYDLLKMVKGRIEGSKPRAQSLCTAASCALTPRRGSELKKSSMMTSFRSKL